MERNTYGIIVVGLGGTGSFVMGDLARYIASASPSIKRSVSVVLADGDLVEDKNRSRQLYFSEDVGRNKADCLAQAINDAYELDVLSSGKYMTMLMMLRHWLKLLKHSYVVGQEILSALSYR